MRFATIFITEHAIVVSDQHSFGILAINGKQEPYWTICH